MRAGYPARTHIDNDQDDSEIGAMKISLGHGTFVRKVENDVLFCNPRSGASMIIEDGGVLCDSLTKYFKSLNLVFNDLANRYGIAPDVVESDFEGIIDEMVAVGLVETANAENKQVSMVHKENVAAPVKKGNVQSDPVSAFYRERKIPSLLHIDVTSNCTERCVHCYLSDYTEKYLKFSGIEKVLSEFRALNGLTVFLSGGECMSHPDFTDIMKRCRQLDLNIVVMSNLTLCDDKMIALLKETEPQYVNVSLYSMSPEEHDRITTVRGSWKRTMRAILACEEAGVDIRIAAPLLRFNRNAFPSLQEFAQKHNMHLVPDFGIVAKSNHDKSNLRYACSDMELEETLCANKQLFDMDWARMWRDDRNAALCDIGVFRIHVNSNGDFYPCPSMSGYVLGNIKDASLKDVWYGEKLQYLRSIRMVDLKQCSNCCHRKYCEPCLASNFNATGSIFQASPEKCQMAAVVHKVYGEKQPC